MKVGGEGDDRGWDGWMASPTWWTWVWVSSRSWWWTRQPGVLQSIGSHRVGHDWVTELINGFSLTNSKYIYFYLFFLPLKIVILCTFNLYWFLPVCHFFPLNHAYVSLFISYLLKFIPDTSLMLKIVRGCLKRAIATG